MMQIGLLRHGEVEGGNCFRGHTDDPLTTTGLNQMHVATRDNQHWDRIISSPLARCAAFAGEYAERHSIPQTFDARLMEMNFGTGEGRCAAELMETDTDALSLFWENPLDNTPPDGEPLALFQARVLDAWHDIVTAHAGRRILVVTHGGVIRVLLCHVLDQPLAQLQSFEVKHGGLYHVQAGDAGKTLSTCDAIRRI
jgi:alpha-ribazole phosphatase